MKDRLLTPEQNYYCELRAKGFNQVDSYKIAFNKPNMKPASLNSLASRLEQHDRILLMIEHYNSQPTSYASDFSKQLFIDELTDIYFHCKMDIELHGIKRDNTTALYKVFDRIIELCDFDDQDRYKCVGRSLKIKLLKARLKNINGSNINQMMKVNELLLKLESQF